MIPKTTSNGSKGFHVSSKRFESIIELLRCLVSTWTNMSGWRNCRQLKSVKGPIANLVVGSSGLGPCINNRSGDVSENLPASDVGRAIIRGEIASTSKGTSTTLKKRARLEAVDKSFTAHLNYNFQKTPLRWLFCWINPLKMLKIV